MKLLKVNEFLDNNVCAAINKFNSGFCLHSWCETF